MKLKAIICGGKDDFGIFIKHPEIIEGFTGANGAGDTVEEAKKNLFECIDILIEENTISKDFLKENEIEFVFDISGFLKYYSNFISFAGMKAITGINQKQLWNYANGYRNPSKATSDKILKSVHSFGENLCKTHFIDLNL
ncbi:hypothetical protein EZS27_021110 [termite gut metagenome]|uniref:Uncharacterized protein n=1 Tax=termite gut metagenome TaxID=433724 RepID=A0A5J4R8U6_9ZZZZ